jgi:hypothetical protein
MRLLLLILEYVTIFIVVYKKVRAYERAKQHFVAKWKALSHLVGQEHLSRYESGSVAGQTCNNQTYHSHGVVGAGWGCPTPEAEERWVHVEQQTASELYRLSDRHLSTKFSVKFCG